MARVNFKFTKKGTERKMSEVMADILYRKGYGTYMTRDMVASRQAPAVATSEPDVDSAGVQWSADLHVASKLKNQNGTWRKKPGAAAALAEESGE
jgi:hypothetical protein